MIRKGIADLVQVDGKTDLAKTAALFAHAFMAAAFVRMQVVAGEFMIELWLTYGGFAITHDAYNRATAMLKDRSDKRIAADVIATPESVSGSASVTTTTTVSQPGAQ